MNKLNIHQAKTQFSRLVELAASGEEVIIAKSGKPVARLVAYAIKGVVRRPGSMEGQTPASALSDYPQRYISLTPSGASQYLPRRAGGTR